MTACYHQLDRGDDFERDESRGTLFFDTRCFGPKKTLNQCTKSAKRPSGHVITDLLRFKQQRLAFEFVRCRMNLPNEPD